MIKLLDTSKSVFTIGSCFAIEVRRELKARGFDVRPRFDELFKKRFVWYNSYSLLYEFEIAFGQREINWDSAWEISDRQDKNWSWQHPLRRLVVCATEEKLRSYSDKIDAEIKESVAASKVFVVTLGLTEVFVHKTTGTVVCAHPKYGLHKIGFHYTKGTDLVEFYDSTMKDNARNLRGICQLLKDNIPDAHVIFTVSPVPLAATFTGLSQNEANLRSKGKLLSAAKTVVAEFDNAHYYDSYEYAQSFPVAERFLADKRHIRPTLIAKIVDRFLGEFEG